uniref:RxLR effector protein n=1 Tax=Phytophthora agathidicida TaxID=1642459 RepID=A0A7G4WI39_9STRA|nr:PaRXLR50 [Phytophthora agathidicida]
MRFYYVALAVVATILASTNAVSADVELTQVSRTAQQIAATAPLDAVKRSLRAHKPAYGKDDSLKSTDSDDFEERGYKVKDLVQMGSLHFNVKNNVSENKLKKLIQRWEGQTMNKHQFAQKLGMRDVNNLEHMNADIFKRFESNFPVNAHPVKVNNNW